MWHSYCGIVAHKTKREKRLTINRIPISGRFICVRISKFWPEINEPITTLSEPIEPNEQQVVRTHTHTRTREHGGGGVGVGGWGGETQNDRNRFIDRSIVFLLLKVNFHGYRHFFVFNFFLIIVPIVPPFFLSFSFLFRFVFSFVLFIYPSFGMQTLRVHSSVKKNQLNSLLNNLIIFIR